MQLTYYSDIVGSMPWTTVRPILLASASGILYPLCFPDFDLGALAWILLIPLHLALQDASLRRAFWLGWLTGIVGFVGTMAWVVTAMHLYGKVPLVVSYALMLLLAAYLGLYVALYAVGMVWLGQRVPRLVLFGAPCVWVSLELLRTYVLSGLPWSLLGYSQYQWLTVIQIADHTGVYGLSFLIVLVNMALTEVGLWAVRHVRHQARALVPWPSVVSATLGMILSLAYGYTQLNEADHPAHDRMGATDRSIAIGLVQANIDQAHKWDPAYQLETMGRYQRLTHEASQGADLVLWPEAATPFLFEQEPGYREEVTSFVRAQNVALLFGSPAVRFHPDGRPYLLNSAYLLSREGTIIGRYDKQHLVPFGEYVPLRSSILFFLDKLVEGIGEFQAGPGPTILEVPSNGADPAMKFGVVVCYEVIFPNLVRKFPARGAEFMVTITNDAWFGKSVAPFQHFGMVVFRAVENRIAFARAANTGVSGFIDPYGRILAASPIFEELTLRGAIPARSTPTFYTRYGDVFAVGCVIMTGILGVAGYRRTWLEARATR